MISAINNINSQPINFQGRGKKVSANKIGKVFKELPYTLGIKKKKTFWEKVGDFFGIQKKSPAKRLKKNCKNGFDEFQTKQDNLLKVLGKDLGSRFKKLDEVLFDS